MRAVLLACFVLLAAAPAAAAAAARTVARCDGARLQGGVARSLSDCTRVDLARGPEAAARQAIGRVAGALRVRPDELGLMSSTPSAAGQRLRFQQFAGGLPVYNGQVTVALARDGRVVNIANGAAAQDALKAGPRLGRARAILTARRRVPSGFDLIARPRATLMAVPRGSLLEPAWLVVLPVRAPRGTWNVLVSARSGDVLDAYDALRHVDGTTQTNVPNPIQATGDATLRDLNDLNQASLDAARRTVPLTDLDAGTLLRGTYADAATVLPGCTLPYVPGSASEASRSYTYRRGDDRFEETVAYAAIDGAMRGVAGLGFGGLRGEPLRVDVHCTGEDNSSFDPFDDALRMGDGGVDDAEDADVVVHELGHAIQNSQVPGFAPAVDSEQGAIGEGFGDVLAAYTYLGTGNASYQAANRFCLMEWDATGSAAAGGPVRCLRRVDGKASDGSDIGAYGGTPREVHDDGRYWSAMVTCVFNGIEGSLGTEQARRRILALVVAHNYDLVPRAGRGAFNDSIIALRDEDNARFGGSEVRLINQCGAERLGQAAIRDPTPPNISGTLAPGAPDGSNGWYRTAPTVEWHVSDPDTGVTVLSGCQGGTDPADTLLKTISCTAGSGGGVLSKTLSYRRDGTPPSLAPVLNLASPRVGQRLTVRPGAKDAASGIATVTCTPPRTGVRGPHTTRCTAIDNAGNRTERALRYTVGARQSFTAARPDMGAKGLRFRLRSNAGGRVKITARAGSVRFRTARTTLVAGRSRRVTLPLSKSARRALARRLQGGRGVRVKLTVTPKLGGGKRTLTLKVRR